MLASIDGRMNGWMDGCKHAHKEGRIVAILTAFPLHPILDKLCMVKCYSQCDIPAREFE